MTISLAAVFIPVLFMGGILGRLLHEFAVTIIVAVLISGFVSLTLTPMLCSRMLRRRAQEAARPRLPWRERMFDAVLRRATSAACAGCCAHRRLTMVVFVAIFVATGVLFSAMPKGFLPSDDSGSSSSSPRRRRTSPSRRWSTCSGRSPRSSRRIPNVEAAMSFVGAGGSSPSLNIGRIFIALKPRDERPSADEIVQQLAARCRSIRGIKAYHAEHAGDPHRRPAHQEPVPVHAAGARHRRALRVGAEGRGEAAHAAGLGRRHQRPADRQAAGDRRHRPRQGVGARRLGAGRSRTRSTTPTARGRCRRSTRRPTSTG